jgi:pre-rRNA-processing protein TSR1
MEDQVCRATLLVRAPAAYARRRAERFKTSLQFVQLPYGRLYAALDACKAADYVVLALSPEMEVAPWGDTLLRALQAQGLPAIVPAVAPDIGAASGKARAGVLRSLLSFVRYFAPDAQRVFDLGAQADALGALRALAEGRPRDVRWREGRARVLAESVRWTAEGALAVTGIVRGAPLSANRLVHVPNYGDFQIAKVCRRAVGSSIG